MPAKVTKTARVIRERIDVAGDRLWRIEDFSDLSPTAVAQTLSRMARKGILERVSKGVYYRGRATTLGKSKPNPADIVKLLGNKKRLFPSGVSAANLLALTTQNPSNREVATTAPSIPRKLIGRHTVVHSRRPEAWKALSDVDAGVLDLLRRRGQTSELSSEETVARLLELLAEQRRFERLVEVASSEPPRVRAMLGAAGEQLKKNRKLLDALRSSLNPLSRFDFGNLSALFFSERWQAKRK